MRRIFTITRLVTAMALLACILMACDEKKDTKKDSEEPTPIDIKMIDQLPDIIEEHGKIGSGTSMNVLEFVSDGGDTLYADMGSQAVMGGEAAGDELQLVYTANDSTCKALIAINITALQHLWTQQAADGHLQSLELNSGGRATTYDMSIEYDHWSVSSGTLLLYSPKKIGDEAPAAVDTFEIMELTSDRLVLCHGQLTSEFVRDN